MPDSNINNTKKPLTKIQKIMISIIGGAMGMFAVATLIFGPNNVAAVTKEDMIEQIRQEKIDYVESRITAQERAELEALLRKEAYSQVLDQIKASTDPYSIDIEVEANKILGL